MFIVITGLDGSGTSSVAKGLNTIDKDSVLLKKNYIIKNKLVNKN